MTEEASPPPPVEEPEAPKRRPRVRRVVLRTGAVLLAVVVGLLLSALTFDLGPQLKGRAEVE